MTAWRLALLGVLLGGPVHAAGTAATPDGAALQLAGSTPVETDLGEPGLPDAFETIQGLIRGAQTSIHMSQFYVSTAADTAASLAQAEGPHAAELVTPATPDRAATLVAELRAAAGRGVAVQVLADAKFAKIYPDTLAVLDATPGIELRRIDGPTAWPQADGAPGGVQHAKYLVVDPGTDAAAAWLGSQNMDWRSFVHVQELGLAVTAPALVTGLADVFTWDWAVAGGVRPSPVHPSKGSRPVPAAAATVDAGGATARVVASPTGHLPAGVDWDLPALIALVDGATTRVRVQLLSYSTVDYGGAYWPDLDNALRAAAARGVSVQLLVSDWSLSSSKLPGLKSLAVLPGIEVRFVRVPEWSGGFVPFARTVHAKFMVVDGTAAWLGTSNWSRDYFHASRNVGLVVDGGALPGQLDASFDRVWAHTLTETLHPAVQYKKPRTR